VKEYLEAHDREVRERKQTEREARWSDPHRTLRPYLTLEEIYAAMEEAGAAFPHLVSIRDYGESGEGRPLRVLTLSTGPGNKPSILYSANIHGNEMAGNMICLALLKYFTQGYGVDRDITYLLDRVDIYIIPVLNPDGMARTVAQQDRFGVVLSLTRKNTNKVDLNRNYPYPPDALDRLHDSAGSNRRFMTNYRGPEPLSEPESQALIRLYEETRFDVHCNWHTTGGKIMSPPATLPEPLPDDQLLALMRQDYRSAMFDPYDEHTELQFYPTIGSLDDYLYHRFGALCVTMEVGKHSVQRFFFDSFHHGTWSPLFWVFNVYALDQEVANNLEGGARMAWWALKVHEDPGLRRWQPSEELWVGEPARE
jgi:predicted deacylase